MNDAKPAAKPEAVYFFGTCLVDLFYPEAGLAAIRLLQRENIRVIYRQGQTCCGQPAFNCGYRDEALAVARAQIALFPEDIPIVIPSGSCAAMMRHHYPALFHGEPDRAAATAFASRVYELSQFLVNVLGVRLEDRGEPIKVTWHASCHAVREMKVTGEPKALLGQLANVEMIELSRERECCGFGGTFSVRYPEISAAMVTDKAADAAATGAAEILSGDCGCLMNISGALDADGVPIRGRHLAEFLWERTRER
ncbi:MAG TPA: (Fe-S)-binding protein [Thermoanaerobaculia bacterium]|nr:(Fe-S)-binding protein [Thermoanaerobaculia bacterium]